MRVLVTGANGFIGRQVVRQLIARRHQVMGLDHVCSPAAGGIAIEGDMSDCAVRARALSGCDAIVHLATIPGGAAEADPDLAWRVNVEATSALMREAAMNSGTRFVFASSIAVLGNALPATVDDRTVMRPTMLYGAHKAMMETWLATLTRRGVVQGLSLRLPGIVARPRSGEGFKSAFLSDVFHAGRAGRRFTMPVSGDATTWIMSVGQAASNLCNAVELPWRPCEPYAATLPAVRTRIADLVAEIARQTAGNPDWIDYAPEAPLEAGFGRLPMLDAALAEKLGLAADRSLAGLVSDTLAQITENAE